MNTLFMNWNVAGALSEELKARQLVQEIGQHQPDVAIFPEAFNEGSEQFLDNVKEDLDTQYRVSLTTYDDDDNRQDRRGMMAIVRHELVAHEARDSVVRLAGRNALQNLIVSPFSGQKVRVVGVHLNDRSTAKRNLEVDDLLSHLMLPTEPTIVHGDINEVYPGAAKGLNFRLAALISTSPDWLFPVGEPESVNPKMSRARIGSLAERLHGMSQGIALQKLVNTGLIDADPLRQPTFKSKKPFAQLDHTLLSESISNRLKSFSVLRHNPLSDHRATLTTIDI